MAGQFAWREEMSRRADKYMEKYAKEANVDLSDIDPYEIVMELESRGDRAKGSAKLEFYEMASVIKGRMGYLHKGRRIE